MLFRLRSCLVLLILLIAASHAGAARVFVLPQGGPPRTQGPPTHTEVLQALYDGETQPELDRLTHDLLSLFRPTGERVSRPSAGLVVLGWKSDGDVLLVADDGTASFQKSGRLWQDGWFDFALMGAIPGLRDLNPIGRPGNDLRGFPLFWRIRLTNETSEVATLFDFADRPLAVVKPGEAIERFLLDRINPKMLGHADVYRVSVSADYSVGFESGVRLPLDPPGGLRARGVDYSREVTRGGVTLRFDRDESTGLYITTLTPREHSTPTWMLAVSIVAIGVVSLILRWLLTSRRKRSVEE